MSLKKLYYQYANKQFILLAFRFVLVGLWNTGLGYGLFVLFALLFKSLMGKSHVWLTATIASHIIASTISFFLNKYFTFKSKGKTRAEIIKYLIISSSQLSLSLLSNFIFTEVIGVYYLLSGLITIIILTALSFLAHLFFSFSSTVNQYRRPITKQETTSDIDIEC